jgi:hypothetical protein
MGEKKKVLLKSGLHLTLVSYISHFDNAFAFGLYPHKYVHIERTSILDLLFKNGREIMPTSSCKSMPPYMPCDLDMLRFTMTFASGFTMSIALGWATF